MGWFGLAGAAIRARNFPMAHAALDKADASPLLKADVLQARAVLDHLESRPGHIRHAARCGRGGPTQLGSIRKRWLEHLDKRGQTTEAARELRVFLDKEQFRSESWLLMGTLLEKIAQPSLAVAAYQQACRTRRPRPAVPLPPRGVCAIHILEIRGLRVEI